MGKKEGPTLDRGVWGKSLTSKMLTLNCNTNGHLYRQGRKVLAQKK
jgi:hypothetical protein